MKFWLLLLVALVAWPLSAAETTPALPKTVLSLTVKNQHGETVVKVIVDTSETPDLADWGKRAGEACAKWTLKISALLASEGFSPPKSVTLRFQNDKKGVAGTSGDKITIAAAYVRGHTSDIGMVIHELTHVVQAYPKEKEGFTKPGWLVEGIADYIRLYHFEPDAPRPRVNPDKASYRDSYKTVAAFMAWLEQRHAGIVKKLNAALRSGIFKEKLFEDCAAKPLDDLWQDFTASLKKK
ncbi:MAG: basic secretory protein-like protein [Verrucomicrobia bacterium]|nr:basic secretory protein-like protein [Verrucomicrobiota bacterium]